METKNHKKKNGANFVMTWQEAMSIWYLANPLKVTAGIESCKNEWTQEKRRRAKASPVENSLLLAGG